LKKPEIILVIAASLDSRIALPNGGACHIGTELDRKLLDKSISQVDATIFGSGTLKAHQNTYLIKEKNFFGNNKKISDHQPISIVVGNSINFSENWNYFKQPIVRWLITSNKKTQSSKVTFDKTFLFKQTWTKTLKSLKREGINKIALLGGSKLIYSFAKEDLIDEIKITICPKIIGGEFSWIPFQKQNEIPRFSKQWKIKMIKVLKTNEIFIHYTKKSNN
tara:strand:- start:48 stop:710 length:663 start_codon:yes stop_codon:yes gene_type:complete